MERILTMPDFKLLTVIFSAFSSTSVSMERTIYSCHIEKAQHKIQRFDFPKEVKTTDYFQQNGHRISSDLEVKDITYKC